MTLPATDGILEKLQALLAYDASSPLIFSSGLFLFLFAGFMLIYNAFRRAPMARIVYVILFSLYFYYKSSGIYFLLLIFAATAGIILTRRWYLYFVVGYCFAYVLLLAVSSIRLAKDGQPSRAVHRMVRLVVFGLCAAGAMVLLIRRAQALMEAAGDDGDFDALCQQLHRYQATLRTCFTLENFDNLIKNGRMRPIVGTLLRSLGIHIIADATAEGTIHVADKARGVGKTYRAITALMKASKDCTDAEVVISHCENLEGAMALKRQILADLPVKQVDLLSCRGLTSFYAMEKGLIVGY